ncbi:hypothetical protein [Azospirillum sp.]|uniref:hypothetical protein n=1 Tax=Azospirillum sp. TaxID=34012 RepID=UPI002D46330A|nr:hypothetical protein [Azospirillum sp.]HYD69779.1 hypothetical protein [Azospirillum sp.]
MIGSDLSSIKSMLTNAFTKAAEAKGKAGAKDAAEPKPAAPRDTSDPAFLLSANLQDLTQRLRGLSDGASDGAKKGVDDADAALAQMQGVAAFTEEFGKQLDSVMDAMGRDLERTLKALGFGDEDAGKAVKGFKGRFGDDERKAALAEARPRLLAAASEEREAASVAVEVRNIELTIQQGDKSLSISFDSASLSLRHSRESASFATDGRSAAYTRESEAAALDVRQTGLTVKADGFTDEELEGVLGALGNVMASDDPAAAFEGLATVTPKDKPKDGSPLGLSLDLMGAFKAAFGGTPAEPAAKGVNLVA